MTSDGVQFRDGVGRLRVGNYRQTISVEGFWCPHTLPIDFVSFGRDHQQLGEGQNLSVSRAFGDAFLLSRLTDSEATVLLLYDWNEFSRFLAYIRLQQSEGTPIDWLVPRLIEFANAHFYAVDVGAAHVGTAPGYHIVGLLLNAIWEQTLKRRVSQALFWAICKQRG
jgi:hypothetical protein